MALLDGFDDPLPVPDLAECAVVVKPRIARWGPSKVVPVGCEDGDVEGSSSYSNLPAAMDDVEHVKQCPDPSTCPRCLYLRQREHWAEASL